MDAVTAGEYILHYRLLEPLGSGGMGVVWKAFDTRLEREVALKFVSTGTGANDDDAVSNERFAREARIASALNHPNIVTIHDINSVNGRRFIVMEVLRGESLSRMLRTGRPSMTDAVAWALQIAGALAQAHAAGIIHRDLKPSNIMVSPQLHGMRNVKVLDFGLAKNVPLKAVGPEDETQLMELTRPGRAVGTIGYQSPEQAMGGSVDPRSDVFAFGILFYEMLSGSRPFPGSTWEEFATNLLHRPPEPIRQLCPDLPDGVAAVIDRCLARDLHLRYANCGEVLSDLKWRDPLASSGFSFTPARPSVANRPVLVPFWQRGKVRVTAAAALLVAIALGIAAYVITRHEQRGIAVLPFTAVTADARTQALSLGLLTALSSDLSSAGPLEKAFWVVPAPDVLQSKTQSAKDARQSFAVDMAITGSIETVGDQVKVTVSVVNASNLHTLHSAEFRASATTPFELEDQLLSKTAELLQVSLPQDARASLRASGSSEPGADDYYLQGSGYVLSGYDKADAAIEVLQLAISKDPRFARAHASLAEAYLLKYRYTKDPVWMAKAQVSSAAANGLNASLMEARIASAEIAREQGHYNEAIIILRQVVQQDPANRIAWTHLGEANESKRDIPAAETAYRKAVDLQPGSPLVHQSLGLFYYRLGRYAEAEKSFNRERELAPDNYRVYSQLGSLDIQLARYPAAEAMLKRSIALKPSAIAYNNLATVYSYLGRPADVVPMMEHALTLGQRNVSLLANLARTYREVPGLEAKAPPIEREAIDLARKQLEVNPNAAETRADLALLYAESGQPDAARTEMQAALRQAPATSAVLFRSVLVNELTGDRAGALTALDALARTGGYLEEIRREPELKQLRNDSHYKEKEAAWQTTK